MAAKPGLASDSAVRDGGSGLIKAGEIWKIVHARKGALTIKFTEDGDLADGDSWLQGEIVAGRVQYMSDENRIAQRLEGQGTPGDDLTMRASLVTLIERVQAPAPVAHGTETRAVEAGKPV